MDFTIIETTKRTSAKGAQYAVAVVRNEHGEDFQNTTLFSPDCTKLVGEKITGKLTPNDYGGKKGWKFLSETPKKTGGNGIAVAMKKKEESIEKFQENKTNSIQTMAIFRDSTLATNLYFERSNKSFEVEEYFNKWREFQHRFELELSQPPF